MRRKPEWLRLAAVTGPSERPSYFDSNTKRRLSHLVEKYNAATPLDLPILSACTLLPAVFADHHPEQGELIPASFQ